MRRRAALELRGRALPLETGPLWGANLAAGTVSPASADAQSVLVDLAAQLRCPACRAGLARKTVAFECDDPRCGARYPVVDGIPVLINEANSLFAIEDYSRNRATTYRLGAQTTRICVDRLLPKLGRNLKARENYRRLTALLGARPEKPRILVVGGRTAGEGMRELLDGHAFSIVESDVSFGPRTTLISDAHDIPFADHTFDAVIAQAVLEHVVDPQRCVAEIHRVLKPDGLVYSEVPFMQQVHGGRFDFTRFTHLGHRRLFRHFQEIGSGAVAGPGTAMAWSYEYFLLAFARSRTARSGLLTLARCTAFCLKYFDGLLLDTPGGVDAASCTYFFGRKSEQTLSDRQLLRLYRGSAQL